MLTIRKFDPRDIDAITELVEATGVFRNDEVDVAVELMDVAAAEPNQKDYILYSGIDEDEHVVGYYCVGPTPMTQSTFDLYWIAVHPQYHGKQFGTTLLQHCEVLVKSMNGTLIVAETSSQPKYQPTRNFYLKNQYTESARIKNYYMPGDDLMIYTKYL
ncbi:MAG TPA: GNAT family N-acetyltransferase [Bacteroidota bacterium]|nr:GNAT family N-acetyltransferase [Bacteroidota bacterium]